MTDHEPGAPGTDWDQRLHEIFGEPGLAGLAAAVLDLREGHDARRPLPAAARRRAAR